MTATASRLHITVSPEFLALPKTAKAGESHHDEGRCQWKFPDVSVCGATVRLQIDHVIPRRKGGPSRVDDCRIPCQGHDLEAARRACGDDVMDLFTRGDSRGPVAREEAAASAPIRATGALPRTTAHRPPLRRPGLRAAPPAPPAP